MNKRLVQTPANGGIPLNFEELQMIENLTDTMLAYYFTLMTNSTFEATSYKSGLILYGLTVSNISGTQTSGTCDLSEGYVYFRMNNLGYNVGNFGYVAYFPGATNVSYPFYLVPDDEVITSATFENGISNSQKVEYRAKTNSTTTNGVGIIFKPHSSRYIRLAQKRFVSDGSQLFEYVGSWLISDTDPNAYFKTSGLGLRDFTGYAIANGNNGTTDVGGRVTVAWKSGDSEFGSVGNTGGAKTHSLTEAQNGAHIHGISDTGHVHVGYSASNPGGTAISPDPIFRNLTTHDGSTTYSVKTERSSTGISLQTSGSGSPHNNLQPYVTCFKLQYIGISSNTQ